MKEQLIQFAKKQYGTIYPCNGHKSLETCFTKEQGELIFWFKLPSGTTEAVFESHLS